MRNYTLLILIFSPLLQLYAQGTKPLVEGKVSYITPQNIYVKFEEAGKVQIVRNTDIFIPKVVGSEAGYLINDTNV